MLKNMTSGAPTPPPKTAPKTASKIGTKTATKAESGAQSVSKRSSKDSEVPIYSAEDVKRTYAPALHEHLAGARIALAQLAVKAPQVLLLEGGVESQRQAMALWWAAAQHCQNRQPDGQPCCRCTACLHIGARIHPDVLAYDGRISNTLDEENPGPIRALNKQNAVILKGKLGDTPRSGLKRIVTICGVEEGSRSAAANALLKVLEEPSPVNLFVLLTAQREQILPTLVSRSFVYTLPWPDTHFVAQELRVWEEALAMFLHSGREWWKMTSTKGAVTTEIALQVLLLCQKRLISTITPGEKSATGALSAVFTKLNPQQRLALSQMLDASHECLQYNVTPARVLDSLVVNIYNLTRAVR